MDAISISIFLEYLYRRFIATFILCLIGAMVRETMNTVKIDMMNVKKMFASVIFASVLLCAVVDRIDMPFSVYAIVCIVAGIWAPTILRLVMSGKFMTNLIGKFAGSVGDPIVKSIVDTANKSTTTQDGNNTEDKSNEDANNNVDNMY